jgi:hypothetical protein
VGEGAPAFPVLRRAGRSLGSVAIALDEVDIHTLLNTQACHRRNLNGRREPGGFHTCIRQRRSQPEAAAVLPGALQQAVERLRRIPQEEGTMGVAGGLTGRVPVKRVVAGLLGSFIDWMDRVD